MSVSDIVIVYYNNVRNKEVLKMKNTNFETNDIDLVLLGLNQEDYIKYLRIDMLGTIDDTHHYITYKKNRKNAGTLTVLNKTMPVDTRFTNEYTIINGHSLVINDLDGFHKFVIDYLKEYSFGFCGGTDYSVWFTMEIKFSNGDILHILVDTSINRELTMKFYDSLSTYNDKKGG